EITNMKFKHIKVSDGDTLALGNKTLHFINAVNLHWPDSIFTYIEEDKTLVTCDAFGAHYSYDKVLLSEMEKEGQQVRDEYIGQVKYYYDAIMSPFKTFMLKAIDRIKDLEIDMICPGHGVVLDKDPWKIVKLSQEWSQPKEANAKKLVVIPYVSAYGYTDALAKEIEKGIKAAGDIDVELYDMVKADKEKVMERLLISDGMLFGTPTMLGDALPPIWDLVMGMFPSICMGKPASAFGAFGWSGEGVPNIIDRLKQLRTKVYGEGLKIRFKPGEDQLKQAFEFGKGFGEQV
nr:FprA family A-type flavoprotein [Bacillota bacterium]